jgi:hypothetical protein
MEEFIKYLDQVRADEKLKEKTKAYIINTPANQQHSTTTNKSKSGRKGDYNTMKLSGLVASLIFCTVLGLGGYAYAKPVSYVSLDINPSVELGINAFNRVVSSEGLNKDGQGLLQEIRLKNMLAENAIQALVLEIANKNYISEDGTSVIALTAQADDEQRAVQLQDRTRDRVQQVLREKNLECVVYADCVNLELRTQARELGLSPGKFRLIGILQALDPSITVEQYRNAEVSEIIVKASELLASVDNGAAQSGEYERNRAMITATAQQIMNMEQNQNQNQNQNQVQNRNLPENQVQEKEQNQIQEQNQTQEQNQILDQNQIQNQTQTQAQDGQEQGISDSGSQDPNANSNGTGGSTDSGGNTGSQNGRR